MPILEISVKELGSRKPSLLSLLSLQFAPGVARSSALVSTRRVLPSGCRGPGSDS